MRAISASLVLLSGVVLCLTALALHRSLDDKVAGIAGGRRRPDRAGRLARRVRRRPGACGFRHGGEPPRGRLMIDGPGQSRRRTRRCSRRRGMKASPGS